MLPDTARPHTVRRSVYRRALTTAGKCWRDGRPGSARDALTQAGLEVLWPTFERTARAWSREQLRRAASGDRTALAQGPARITGRRTRAPVTR